MINLTTVYHVTAEPEGVQHSARKLLPFAEAYRKDPDYRSRVDSDPIAALVENDVEVLPDTEVRIVEDSDEVFHFVLPPDYNSGLEDEVLDMAAGGKSAASRPSGPVNRGCYSPPDAPGFTGWSGYD